MPLRSLLARTARARVRIVYVEAPAAALPARNRDRPRPVPPGAMERMRRRWEPPDLTEAHERLIVGDEAGRSVAPRVHPR